MKLKKVKLTVISTVLVAIFGLAYFMPGSLQAGNPPAFNPAAAYKSKCASCHGLDGSGNTAYGKKEKLKDLRSAEVKAMSDAQLLEIIAKGKKKMPGYEKSLGADMCKQLVTYIRQL